MVRPLLRWSSTENSISVSDWKVKARTEASVTATWRSKLSPAAMRWVLNEAAAIRESALPLAREYQECVCAQVSALSRC